jgi:hypothetical protein
MAQNATHFFIAPQKRRVQPERYVPFFAYYFGSVFNILEGFCS